MKSLLARSPSDASQLGFASYNPGEHLCVEIPEGWFTISVKTPNGKKITFAFCPQDGGGHQCVDILHHTSERMTKNGESQIPVQFVSVRGPGPLLYATPTDTKETQPTCTILSLRG